MATSKNSTRAIVNRSGATVFHLDAKSLGYKANLLYGKGLRIPILARNAALVLAKAVLRYGYECSQHCACARKSRSSLRLRSARNAALVLAKAVLRYGFC